MYHFFHTIIVFCLSFGWWMLSFMLVMYTFGLHAHQLCCPVPTILFSAFSLRRSSSIVKPLIDGKTVVVGRLLQYVESAYNSCTIKNIISLISTSLMRYKNLTLQVPSRLHSYVMLTNKTRKYTLNINPASLLPTITSINLFCVTYLFPNSPFHTLIKLTLRSPVVWASISIPAICTPITWWTASGVMPITPCPN